MEHEEVAERVEIDPAHLEVLLHYARIGEVARSRRSWRHGLRRQACCSGSHREPDCIECQAFTAAEVAVEAKP